MLDWGPGYVCNAQWLSPGWTLLSAPAWVSLYSLQVLIMNLLSFSLDVLGRKKHPRALGVTEGLSSVQNPPGADVGPAGHRRPLPSIQPGWALPGGVSWGEVRLVPEEAMRLGWLRLPELQNKTNLPDRTWLQKTPTTNSLLRKSPLGCVCARVHMRLVAHH